MADLKIKHFGLRVDSELLTKFRLASMYEGRSANSQLIILMRNFVKEYEKKVEADSPANSDKQN